MRSLKLEISNLRSEISTSLRIPTHALCRIDRRRHGPGRRLDMTLPRILALILLAIAFPSPAARAAVAPPAAPPAPPAVTVEEAEDSITIETDTLRAAVRKKGYVSGLAEG